jgi:predicted aspartyl protease
VGDKTIDPRGIDGNRQDGPKGEQETTGRRTEGVVNPRETSARRQRGGIPAHALSSPTLSIITERTGNRLVAQGWVADKPSSVNIDTGAAVTVIRPDIAAGLPEREPSTKCALQTASGETLPILKEAFVTLTLGRRPLGIYVFVADITDELILGLDILRAYDASVDLGSQMLRL